MICVVRFVRYLSKRLSASRELLVRPFLSAPLRMRGVFFALATAVLMNRKVSEEFRDESPTSMPLDVTGRTDSEQ